MAVTINVLVPPKTAEASQVTQYIANGVKAIIDKFTATNYSGAAATLTVNLVTSGGVASSINIISQTKNLQAGETYTFPEVVGHVLGPGDYISTLAGTAAAVNIRVSGREVT